ncbi:protein phosphatase 1L isoform X2 [Chrysoperla carnea]|nr:protein phosphatase 1L isoform X2 [Chrysoperla carnea]XP_044742428.1 protein phosphatase 1L isoform X2 [Chrysoperla carnea]
MTKGKKLQFFSGSNIDGQKQSWQLDTGNIAAYAVQGHRPRMEDRFVVVDNIKDTGVSLFAVFDGHGGEFAANYAQEKLIENLRNKIYEIKNLVKDKKYIKETIIKKADEEKEEKKDKEKEEKKDKEKLISNTTQKDRQNSFRRTISTATDDGPMYKLAPKSRNVTDPELLQKILNLRPITREVHRSSSPNHYNNNNYTPPPIESYIDRNGKINYGKLLTDEVLAADRLLVEDAKKNLDVAGTTALIALLEGTKLIVANVGDSRGVMCDSKGNAIPLSFDHKPQQVRERNRIKEAGGFVTFNGVWRVAGILATSRALGDYPLKEKKLVIADPDILTFDLADHKPSFLIFASDGLWDTFSNEEAIAFIKERLNEPHYGAKSITLQSYYRGSLDNITVLVIHFKENAFHQSS